MCGRGRGAQELPDPGRRADSRRCAEVWPVVLSVNPTRLLLGVTNSGIVVL